MNTNDWTVVIGEIVSPFGLRGEVKVLPQTDFPERFEEIEEALVGKGAGGRQMKIEKVRFHKGLVLVKFAGVDDISTAELLRGMQVRIKESEQPPLEENEYYIHDIIGLDVVTTEGKDLGKVTEVLQSPANDVYITDRAMIPAVKEFVVSIDLDQKKMVVKAVEGLEI
jgi:16S rRNA processing protein RimM